MPSSSSVDTMPSTLALAKSFPYRLLTSHASTQERTSAIYQRMRALIRTYGLTINDILNLTPKFWALHMDLIAGKDGGVMMLLSIQLNLVAGTIAPFARERPELRPVLQQILNCDVSAQFMLSEIGHGLDARNLKTTATLQPDGSYILNSPTRTAAKYMPPTGPVDDMPRIGLVFARLVVNGEDRGIRPFLTPLSNGKEMYKGITIQYMPIRAGTNPVDHAITHFDHIPLGKEALIGSIDKPRDPRESFLDVTWRVSVGSLAMSVFSVPMLTVATYIAGKYSIRRTVTGPDGKPLPIISFRTQQLPIFHALAQSFVLKAYALEATRTFSEFEGDIRVRRGLGACIKSIMVHHAQSSLYDLAERCGAHGLYEHNQIIQLQLDLRGQSIAEGDALALSIRLGSELLIGRYEMPQPTYPNSYLARHERGFAEQARKLMKSFTTGHRGDEFSRLILPLCQPYVEAIGHRMAYEFAVKAHVDKNLIDLYVVNVIKRDVGWYVEHAGLTQREITAMEDRAVTALMPKLEDILESTGAGPYVHAPILTEESWWKFMDGLPELTGNATPTMFEEMKGKAPTLKLPPELVDLIIDQCWGDTNTLRAVSLASKTCMARARLNLFHTVVVGSRLTPKNDKLYHLLPAFSNILLHAGPSIRLSVRIFELQGGFPTFSSLYIVLSQLPRLHQLTLRHAFIGHLGDPPATQRSSPNPIFDYLHSLEILECESNELKELFDVIRLYRSIGKLTIFGAEVLMAPFSPVALQPPDARNIFNVNELSWSPDSHVTLAQEVATIFGFHLAELIDGSKLEVLRMSATLTPSYPNVNASCSRLLNQAAPYLRRLAICPTEFPIIANGWRAPPITSNHLNLSSCDNVHTISFAFLLFFSEHIVIWPSVFDILLPLVSSVTLHTIEMTFTLPLKNGTELFGDCLETFIIAFQDPRWAAVEQVLREKPRGTPRHLILELRKGSDRWCGTASELQQIRKVLSIHGITDVSLQGAREQDMERS
ncbi:hypothetical protein EIP91_011783 [Steccherinum ochraceum]|uniref:Acyl-CoA oxidase C-alpha1 domain-containing protein n=1 Tax=Steccherinum ochraceum TaxID=92696 RepID=A0A4R0RR66_9APHY|nr:hypothetical protein EIP91_011783 [Steccherinum ochraceum]